MPRHHSRRCTCCHRGVGPCTALRPTAHAAPPLLQRAQNWLGAVVVPRSQLVSNGGDFYEAYATQLSILRSYTDGAHCC